MFAPADLGSVRGKLATGLDPAVTIPQMVLAGLVFRDATVRPDGTITMPLIGDVKAAGQTPSWPHLIPQPSPACAPSWT